MSRPPEELLELAFPQAISADISISSHFKSTTFCPAFGCHVGKVTVARDLGSTISGSAVDAAVLGCLVGRCAAVHPDPGRLAIDCSQFRPSYPSLQTQM